MINKSDLIDIVDRRLHDMDYRKKTKVQKSVIHISDDNGNKTDFYVNRPGSEYLLSKKDVSVIVNCLIEAVVDHMICGETVDIFGLGVFKLAKRSSTGGVNPSSGEPFVVGPSYHTRFVPALRIRQANKLITQSVRDGGSEPDDIRVESMDDLPEHGE